MTHAYIIAARRTVVAPSGGLFKDVALHDLAAPVLQTCLADANCPSAHVNDVILSNALCGGGNPARMAALAAGLPVSVAGLSIDRQCAGGLDAVLLANDRIKSGSADIILAGGAESHSTRPHRLTRTTPPQEYERPAFAPSPYSDPDLALAADALAQSQGITRQGQTNWAVHSHAKAQAADLRPELVAPNNEIPSIDPFTRRLTPSLCERAKPIAGSITHANTAVSADGAAFVLVVSEAALKQLKPAFALKIIAGKTLGGVTSDPGLAPIAAVQAALLAANLSPKDITVAEVMEAYAAQTIACVNGIGLNPDCVNLGGGALARGHPIGASGAVLAVRLFYQMKTAQLPAHGLAAIAAAGGLGTALIVDHQPI